MHYYQHNIGDYRKDTAHLSVTEHGIYRQLLDWYYLDENPIPKETQVVIRRLRLASESDFQALNNVLSDFFVLQDDGYHQLRCDYEIDQYQHNAAKNRANGKLGGRPKKTQSVILANPNKSEIKGNQEPRTKNHKPITKEPNTMFGEFWTTYPKKVGKDAAQKAFEKRKPDSELLRLMIDNIDRQKESPQWQKDGGQYIPNPATWLNQGRWMDEFTEEPSSLLAGGI